LYDRGIDLDFIKSFEIGYAPSVKNLFQQVMKAEGVPDLVLEQAGLILVTESGRKRDFFSERITFPIRDALGAVIGFSARKIKEEAFGGKYINTAETPLFKKSQVLFGLSYSRKRIAKDRRAIIVEGQIDALRLIHTGFNFTVAGQGTAFGEGHAQELCNLGVHHVFLALDGDTAGQEATVKIGDIFQKKGVEVSVVPLPERKDPDSFLKEEGPEAFVKLLEESQDYLTFLVGHLSKTVNLDSPSGKSELVEMVTKRIKAWDQPIMVHESLRRVAELVGIPESLIGVDVLHMAPMKRSERAFFSSVDPDRILETDLLRWALLAGQMVPKILDLIRANLQPLHFRTPVCRRLYELCFKTEMPSIDFTLFSACLEKEEDQSILSEIMQRKVNLQKAEEGVIETIRKILQRQWMEEREAIKAKIHSGKLGEEEVLELAKEFDAIKKKHPEVVFL
jgi:DNA primase